MNLIASKVKNIKKTINGYEINTDTDFIIIDEDRQSKIMLEIDLLSTDGNILETKVFDGNRHSTIQDLKKLFDCPVDIVLCKNRRRSVISNENIPICSIFENENDALNRKYKIFLFAEVKLMNHQSISCILNSIDCRFLRKLVIQDTPLSRISISDLMQLKYLKIINCGLNHINIPSHTMEYCNLKNNLLGSCNLLAKTLILQDNLVQEFSSSASFKYLNLSSNPLKRIKCKAKFLNIRNTNINHVLCGNFEIILADHVRNFRVGKCPNLKVLSANDCQISQIYNTFDNIRVLKLRNNYLHHISKLNNCLHLDVSGNFLEKICCKSIVSLNISKNQFDKFKANRFKSLRHLNISFNNMELLEKDLSNIALKTLIINKAMTGNLICSSIKPHQLHQCKRHRDKIFRYKMESYVNGWPIIMFITFTSSKLEPMEQFFIDSFEKFRMSKTIIDLISQFSNYCYKKLNQKDGSARISFLTVSSNFFYVTSFYIPTVIFTFSEIDVVDDPGKIRIFRNVSNWCCFPLFCSFDSISKNRSHTFLNSERTLIECFQFLNFFCPISLDLIVFNSSKVSLINRLNLSTRCKIIKMIDRMKYKIAFTDLIQKITPLYCNPINTSLGFQNINFGLNLYVSDLIHTDTEPTIFVFMKILFRPNINYLIQAEEFNIFSTVELYCKVFSGKIVEKNYKLFIVGFNTTLHSALFSLKIQSILRSIGIDVGIGISSDAVFRTEYNGVVYVGGPVFNKASRIADMGVGVFCCGCVKIMSPLIEMNDEGERYLKGFDKKHRIYSLSIAK